MSSLQTDKILAAIDLANSADPQTENWQGQDQPRELVYGQRMSLWLDRLYADASDELRIAVRAQHLERWLRPRSDYPDGRDGYRNWRVDCSAYHAKRAGEIMAEHGASRQQVDRVSSLIRKQNIKSDPDAQALEDCAALVFLEFYFNDFLVKYDDYSEAKMIRIIQRTWKKMSETGQDAALSLDLDEQALAWVRKALG